MKRTPQFRPVTQIGDLRPDPRNARKHNPKNIGLISDSLRAVGAGRSIVIDEKNEILAGNGLVEAAAEAGITKVQVVDADGETIIAVRRANLTPAQKQQLAIYDNRTAELADWDVDVLREFQAEGLDLAPFEFGATFLENGAAGDATIAESYQVLITCKSESDQGRLLERLTTEGYPCRALMS